MNRDARTRLREAVDRTRAGFARARDSRATAVSLAWLAGVWAFARRLWSGGAREHAEATRTWRRDAWDRYEAGPWARRAAAVRRGTGRSWRWLRGNRVARRLGVSVAICAVAVAGAMLGVTLTGSATVPIGPFQSSVSIEPATRGETRVALPPLGSLTLDSHAGPVKLDVSLNALDQTRTQALVADPDGLSKASETVPEDVVSALITVAFKAIAGAVLATLVLAGLLFRNMRRTAIAGGLALALTAGVIGLAAATLRPQSIEEPRYEGLLANAPAVVGEARQIADRYEAYRAQLQKMVTNAAQLYTTARTLPNFTPDPNTVRVLHVSDLHLNPAAWSVIATVVEQFQIQVVVDTGDITDWGTEQEAKAFTAAIGDLPVPYVYIRGNHDSEATADAVRVHDNAFVLDGDTVTVAGLTFAGIGDPRFTPDKSSEPGDVREEQVMYNSGAKLARIVAESPTPVDVALVHDPVSASPLGGKVPLVLAGHRHQREVSTLPDSTTRLMVEGSTGAAGLRGLEHDQPTPMELSVLYFHKGTKVLQAYDDITLGGTGQAEVSLQRHVIDAVEPENGPGSPSPSAS
ncbi:membrane protein [Actinorhabdospora filicis]|uniref:Membrane protein n=1 Tax=Actinorhabdospora filicis TaxID=1785913 RepID=A0A9W6SPI6_9ACTN|nr:metallophosphoesterase [Actinorhabdospora filicis]GLZ79816.1 membrane protein [Actinorhabdospora filicis]